MKEDKLFIEALQTARKQMIEERAETTETDDVTIRIAEDYENSIKKLDVLLPHITEIFDIYEFEEEDFLFIIEVFENYVEYFVVDGRTDKTLQRDLKVYNQLEEILEEFYSDDEDDYDDEENEDYTEED